MPTGNTRTAEGLTGFAGKMAPMTLGQMVGKGDRPGDPVEGKTME
ncbi:hypothetical protein [Phormidium sp. CCY1219]|nr:hypothetical protein [Phormidium sp. CCY1219]